MRELRHVNLETKEVMAAAMRELRERGENPFARRKRADTRHSQMRRVILYREVGEHEYYYHATKGWRRRARH